LHRHPCEPAERDAHGEQVAGERPHDLPAPARRRDDPPAGWRADPFPGTACPACGAGVGPGARTRTSLRGLRVAVGARGPEHPV